MTPRTPNQNKEIREETRQQIKDAAFELFAEQGFANTSVRSIAQKADKSKGLIYHYFDGKNDILQSIFEDLAALGDEAMDFPEGLSSTERLQYLLDMIFGYIKDSTEVVRLMISLALQPKAIATIKSSIEQYNAQQIEVMKPIFKDLGCKDPAAEAYYLAAKLDGITLGLLTLGDDYPFETMKQKVLEDYVSKQ